MYTKLSLAFCALYAGILGSALGDRPQLPLPGLPGIPGGSIVVLCPESPHDDILRIERIVNRPQTPYLQVLSSTLSQLYQSDPRIIETKRSTSLSGVTQYPESSFDLSN